MQPNIDKLDCEEQHPNSATVTAPYHKRGIEVLQTNNNRFLEPFYALLRKNVYTKEYYLKLTIHKDRGKATRNNHKYKCKVFVNWGCRGS